MEALLQELQTASTTVQAVAVGVGGLVGVFATLFLFWVLMAVARLIARGK